MSSWKQTSAKFERLLRLKSNPVAYKRFDNDEIFEKIPNIRRLTHTSTFCQILFQARVYGWTVGVTKEDARSNLLFDRCARINGLRIASEKSVEAESRSLATTWMPSVEGARKQQEVCPRVPAGAAILVAPLANIPCDPDIIIIFGNPAQIMTILCGLQKQKYEYFQFSFIGEGACADSLAKCYLTGKPSVTIPCYGERSLGQVADDEMVIALPIPEVERAVAGIEKLAKIGLGYPIRFKGGIMDVAPVFAERYPRVAATLKQKKNELRNLH